MPYKPEDEKYKDLPSEDNIGYISSEEDVICSSMSSGADHKESLRSILYMFLMPF
jgi:hypothetical protein